MASRWPCADGAVVEAITSAESAGEVAPGRLVLRAEDERDQGGPRFNEREAELPGQVVAERGCTHLGDGKSARGDDERGGGEAAGGGFDAEASGGGVGLEDGQDAGCELDAYAGGRAFGQQQVEDVVGGAVAKELAKGLLVPGDAVRFDHGEEVLRGEAGEGGLGKVRVGGEEVFRGGIAIREVAAAAAGDEDLLAGTLVRLEDEDAAPAASRLNGAHKAGGAGAEDEDVDFGGWSRHRQGLLDGTTAR